MELENNKINSIHFISEKKVKKKKIVKYSHAVSLKGSSDTL